MEMRSKFSSIFIFIMSMVILLPYVCCSQLPQAAYSPFNHTKNHNELNARKTYEISLHGLLLWASLGFLMPIGILIIKMSQRQNCATTLKFYFYFHLLVQVLAVLLATTGAIMSIKTFENSFNNKHQRIGLALYCAIWVQAVLGFLRPNRGTRKRSLWYIVHWVFGTMICIFGTLNIFTGLEAYKKRTKRSVELWKILFTIEIILIVFLYLLQDKWDYLKKQRVSLGQGEQVRPSSDQENTLVDNVKDLWKLKEPCSKTNPLRNLFK